MPLAGLVSARDIAQLAAQPVMLDALVCPRVRALERGRCRFLDLGHRWMSASNMRTLHTRDIAGLSGATVRNDASVGTGTQPSAC